MSLSSYESTSVVLHRKNHKQSSYPPSDTLALLWIESEEIRVDICVLLNVFEKPKGLSVG